jgi:hypothetical protein
MLRPALYDKCPSGAIPKPGTDAIVSENCIFLYSDVVGKLHKLTFLLTIDYASRQAYNVCVIMATCEHWEEDISDEHI